MKWPKDENGKHQPELAYYECAHCGESIQEHHRPDMLLAGQWIAEAPFAGIAGFWINELYSPWSSWADIVARFLKVKNDPDRLKTFINTCLGEPWVEDEESVEAESLLSHRIHYAAQVPNQVLVLTAGVDVQKDRLEVEIKGWGVGKESWSIDYRILHGSPEESYVWGQLDLLWQEQFQHESGSKLLIEAACIDSGNWTSFVYDYCRNKKTRRIFCIKGDDGEGRPMVAAPKPKKTGKNRRPVDLFVLGVDGIKGLIYERLKKHTPGPGYMHFPAHYQEDYFKGLTSEVIQFKYERGHQKRVWKKIRKNEPLDCTAYSVAALEILNPPLETMARLQAETGKFRAPATAQRERRIRNIGARHHA
jgi:phage terminase large subunit GpA-like protein